MGFDGSSGWRFQASLPAAYLCLLTSPLLSVCPWASRFLMGIAAQPPAGKAQPERWISFCKVGMQQLGTDHATPGRVVEWRNPQGSMTQAVEGALPFLQLSCD